jgi:hypothetical protein
MVQVMLKKEIQMNLNDYSKSGERWQDPMIYLTFRKSLRKCEEEIFPISSR